MKITLRCLKCRWVFSTAATSPTCPHCGSGAQFHELCSEDFIDPARYAAYGPGFGTPPLKRYVTRHRWEPR